MTGERDWLDYVDVFGGLMMGFLTFMLGFAFSGFIERRKTRRDLKATYNFFEIYWKRQIVGIEKQIKVMSDFVATLENYKSFEGVVITTNIQPFYMYDGMDKQKLVESFTRINKEKIILDRMALIELHRSICNQYVDVYDVFKKKNREFGEQWNATIGEFHSTMQKIMAQPLEELLAIPEVMELNSLYNLMEDSFGPDEHIKIVINPMDEYLQKIYSADPSNQYALALLHILTRLVLINEHNQTHISKFARGLQNQIDTLRQSFEKTTTS